MSRLPIQGGRDEQRRTSLFQSSPGTDGFADDDEPPLSAYRDMLLDRKWLIASIVGLALFLALAYVTLATPIYRANLLLQIEDSAPESKSYLTDTTGLGELKTTAAGEMQVLGSRMVLGAAVDQVGLQVSAEPRYLPVVGAWMARRAKEPSSPGFFGLGGYVTGNERIVVNHFKVPPSFEDTGPFMITAQSDGKYTVSHELLDEDLTGVVGKPTQVKLADGVIDVQIDQLAGKPGAEFVVSVASRLRAIERLQERLLMSEQGRQSNVVSVALEDSDRARLGATLNAIADQYVKKNMDRKSAEAEKTLEFLNSQLPVFERQLKASEDAFARFRNANGTVAFDEEAKVWLKSTADLQTNLLELQQNRLEQLRVNSNEHPKVLLLNQQIAAVQSQLGSLNKKIAAMPNMQRDALRLERDVRANSVQYQSMQNNALQMRLLKEGKIGNVRLLDMASVSKIPVKPQKALIVAFALVASLLLTSAIALALARSKRMFKSPQELATAVGLELRGVMPGNATQNVGPKRPGRNDPAIPHGSKLLTNLQVEALQGMRLATRGLLQNAENNLVLVASASSNTNATALAQNFSAVLAQSRKKVLLIDANFKKPDGETYSSAQKPFDFSALVAGSLLVEQTVQSNIGPNLDLINLTAATNFDFNLLESPSFERILTGLSANYDQIIVSAAPILAANEGIALAPLCGTVLLVAKQGVTSEAELNEAVRRLMQTGAAIDGLLVEEMKPLKHTAQANVQSNAVPRKPLSI